MNFEHMTHSTDRKLNMVGFDKGVLHFALYLRFRFPNVKTALFSEVRRGLF